MDAKIKVSVIIPVFNTDKYLAQCLESLVNQTLKEIEIICVDDGSTDNSVEVIRKFQKEDRRIHLIQQKNRGGGAARNRGLMEARGEYLSFLDSDDYFEAGMLEKMARKLDETQSDICITKVRCWHEDWKGYTKANSAMREEYLPDKEVFNYHDMPGYIFNTFHNWPWNKMFRHSFVEEKGLRFQEISRTNDLYFSCTALINAERIVTLKEEMVNYRIGISGNCQSTNAAAPLDFYQAFRKLKDYLIEKGIYEEVKQSFVNHAMDGTMANLISQEAEEKQEKLYQLLKNEIFEALDITGHPEEYFYQYNERKVRIYHIMMNKNYKDFLRFRIQELKEVHTRSLQRSSREKQKNLEEKRRLKTENEELKTQIDVVYCSFSYRVGHTVTAPVRFAARAIRKVCKGNRLA